MSEMIDRLAVEFSRKNLEGCEEEGHIASCRPDLCRCRFFAGAAIEAMREPTQAMLDASWNNVREVKPDDRMAVLLMSTSMAHRVKTLNRWRAMIDAALKESA